MVSSTPITTPIKENQMLIKYKTDYYYLLTTTIATPTPTTTNYYYSLLLLPLTTNYNHNMDKNKVLRP